MKNFYIAITFLCAALIAFLVLIACALTDKPEEPQAVAPEINADGLQRFYASYSYLLVLILNLFF